MQQAKTVADAPSVWDQVTKIVGDGLINATTSAVNRAQPQPQPAQPAPTIAGGSLPGRMQSVPLWGWALGGVAVAGMLFMALKK